MPISRDEAIKAVEEFKSEYKGLANIRYVFLETEKDFQDAYGNNAAAAIEAWDGKLGAFSRSTNTIALALAANHDKSEIASTLAHEGIGHSGVNTFAEHDKRALLDAITEARNHPGALRDNYWKAVEEAYPATKRSEQAEEVFCLMVETVAQRKGYNPQAFNHAWQNSVVQQNEPLQPWGLAQIAEHVAQGLRENTRQQQIFPENDQAQFRATREVEKLPPAAQSKLDSIIKHLDTQNFSERERAIVLARCRENALREQSRDSAPAEIRPPAQDLER